MNNTRIQRLNELAHSIWRTTETATRQRIQSARIELANNWFMSYITKYTKLMSAFVAAEKTLRDNDRDRRTAYVALETKCRKEREALDKKHEAAFGILNTDHLKAKEADQKAVEVAAGKMHAKGVHAGSQCNGLPYGHPLRHVTFSLEHDGAIFSVDADVIQKLRDANTKAMKKVDETLQDIVDEFNDNELNSWVIEEKEEMLESVETFNMLKRRMRKILPDQQILKNINNY